MKALRGVRVLTSTGDTMEATVVFDRVIRQVIPGSPDVPGAETIPGDGLLLTPGMVDLHIHGIAGFDGCDGTPEALMAMSEALARHGITSFLPATMTLPREQIRLILANVGRAMESPQPGARILGAHLEGPFISPERPGAQDPKFIAAPDPDLLEEFRPVIKVVTFAPERDPDHRGLNHMLRLGMIPSAGHSNASYREASEAFGLGVRSVTHLFNAMSPFQHREPGLVGAALDHRVHCEIILDGIHCHPAAVRLALKALGEDRLVPVSDSMRAADLGEGVFSLGGQRVTVSQRVARLDNGAIAGSVITLEDAVRNLRDFTGLPLERCILMASRNPSELLQDRSMGAIEPLRRADMVLWDRDRPVRTYVEGREVFSS
ncbi:N-acetylglucosamine-6-phosphate deacetylase [Thermanaerovibrio acidaminovorans DSM 6589]|uniref:N-acetylglucosamine-6-phosphate deacetylase n=1 Tax=Thermanaerovibrio acidaminovorans (strain ATCC 49978 / DSM 6589 / Su883) TaxID=525903 RepID=D1B873_THEAS|nr:N-acetylglucosamine-6-phosphate deacetylase [Thermanaerovibrio acidaminovorans]ACZ18476.1 N-acetylglucosamine-6-phosphate deacetylase [Thermanaerovibrio acidaminovorans DSM 6589]